MRRITKLLMAMCLAGGTLSGTSCTTDMRDAVLTGTYDFVSGTTTDLLSEMISGFLGGGQQG